MCLVARCVLRVVVVIALVVGCGGNLTIDPSCIERVVFGVFF
jgi:hypothetical protein